MERITGSESLADFAFDNRDINLSETSVNPEAFPGCLVKVIHAANRGSGDAREAIMTTVGDRKGSDIAMACGKCGITMVRDRGVVYGAALCPLVQSGQESLSELA